MMSKLDKRAGLQKEQCQQDDHYDDGDDDDEQRCTCHRC